MIRYKLNTALLFLTVLCASLELSARNVPAFPGAEGFGMYTIGGRGGKVFHVTTLDDNGDDKQPIEGSFRWAVKKREARTIVFDLSGTIHLKSELKMSHGNVTIAGQTAPGDGICVADYPFVISCDNVIIRFMRFRLGNNALKSNPNAHEGDGLGSMDHHNIIVDHCSISWSIDECCSVYGGKNITVQWCIVSQSLRNSGHEKGAHGYGGNWGGSGASYHHNLLAHHDSRCPRLGPRSSTQEDERVDIRNNVYFNWGGNGCYGGEGQHINIVNNYYKPGPGTAKRGKKIEQRIAQLGVRNSQYTKHNTDKPNRWDIMWHRWGKYYIEGNVNSKYPEITADNWTQGVYAQTDVDKTDDTWTKETRDTIRLREPIRFPKTTTHTAEMAFQRVLDFAGCSLHRDQVDELMVTDTRFGVASHTGTKLDKKGRPNNPGIIDDPEDNRPEGKAGNNWSAWPELKSLPAPADTDGDGIPDDWEKEVGMNPNDASDGNIIHPSGYTYLEIYLSTIVASIMQSGNDGGELMGK
jgi:hypothetical protein